MTECSKLYFILNIFFAEVWWIYCHDVLYNLFISYSIPFQILSKTESEELKHTQILFIALNCNFIIYNLFINNFFESDAYIIQVFGIIVGLGSIFIYIRYVFHFITNYKNLTIQQKDDILYQFVVIFLLSFINISLSYKVFYNIILDRSL